MTGFARKLPVREQWHGHRFDLPPAGPACGSRHGVMPLANIISMQFRPLRAIGGGNESMIVAGSPVQHQKLAKEGKSGVR